MSPPWALVIVGFKKGRLKGPLLFLLFWLAFADLSYIEFIDISYGCQICQMCM